MFSPIHSLLQPQLADSEKFTERWNSRDGYRVQARVLELIRAGAGEDFLQSDFESGSLPILETMWDLKGLQLANEDLHLPRQDNFENIDFSFARFSHCNFHNGYFACQFRFARLVACRFEHCTFQFTQFYAATLEDVTFVSCDFIEGDSFVNCALTRVPFNLCFIPQNVFVDCQFDQGTAVSQLQPRPVNSGSSLVFDERNRAQIYRAIKDAYSSGSAFSEARSYFFMEMQSIRRHNLLGRRQRILPFLFELIAGYGVKPARVLATLALVFLFSTLIFYQKESLADALLLASGGIFTFGAKADVLKNLGFLFTLWYVLSAFLGISLTALFVTVLANVFLRER